MSERPSKLRLLHPKWMLLHLAVIAVCCTMVWLGRWQWHAAIRHHGELRNYAYALQWWAFVIFTLVMWTRVVGDFLRGGEPREKAVKPAPAGNYVAYRQAASAPAVETDPERQRLNAYLAALNNPEPNNPEFKTAELTTAELKTAELKTADREAAE